MFEGYTILGNRLQLRSFQIWQKNQTGPDFKTLHTSQVMERQLRINIDDDDDDEEEEEEEDEMVEEGGHNVQ